MKRAITQASVASVLLFAAVGVQATGTEVLARTQVVVPGSLLDLASIVPALAERRVVFVGEQHHRYDHHLNQLAIIRGIHARHADLAVGLEFFQHTDQPHLDAYIAQDIDEMEMFRRTRFKERWSVDSRHYAPILRYAREHGIPLVGLNLPDDLVSKVRRHGIAGLDAEDRALVPEIDRSDEEYRERLRRIYGTHPPTLRDFERFVEVQLLWDEAMAARAAGYLKAHPGRRMVILAGNVHVAYGSGIPRRLHRRLAVDYAIVVQGVDRGVEPGIADYLLISDDIPLPPED
jgi:uncharacterized iron-regulated protein